jgi:hypothetical protein
MLSGNRLIGAVGVFAFLAFLASGGGAASPVRGSLQESFDLDVFLDEALAESRRYSAVFQNLTAEETQEKIAYDDEGRISGRRTIVSDFIVYRSAIEGGKTEEYRDIRAVDGEPVEDASERQRALTADLSGVETVEEELARIRQESSRFNIGAQYYGLSLGTEHMSYRSREAFEFQVVGREPVEDRTLVAIRYRQIAQAPRITINIRGFPDDVEFAWSGTIWLDAESGELWRSEDELLAEGYRREPIVLMRHQKQYRESSFGILVPARFEYTVSKPDDFDVGDRTTLEYGPFRRFAAEVEIGGSLNP